MKRSITFLLVLAGINGFAQNSNSLLLGYLGNGSKDACSGYIESPATAMRTKADQVLFQSTDGGTTWIDLSKGLPEKTEVSRILPKDGGIYLGTRDGKLYHNSNLQSGMWELQDLNIKTKEGFFTGIFDLSSGLYASIYKEGLYKLETGTKSWKPVFANLEEKTIFSAHETSDGNILLGTSTGIYISKDKGKNWDHVYKNWVNEMVFNSDMWIANSAEGVIRSTDNGEKWTVALSEVGSNFKISIIDGYFVVIRLVGSYNRSIGYYPYVSYSNDGLTWLDMNPGKPADVQILDLEKVDKYLFSSREAGISRSSDLGKTWQLLVAAPDKYDPWQFDMVVANNTIFAVLKWGGC